MRQSLLRLVSATTLVLLGGCGSDPVTPAPLPVGEYALETVNGLTLPFLKGESAAERVEVVSGSVTLRSDRTYSGQIIEQWTSAGNTVLLPVSRAGTFSVSGNRITFAESGSGTLHHGTVSGNRISATMNDVTFGFVKQ